MGLIAKKMTNIWYNVRKYFRSTESVSNYTLIIYFQHSDSKGGLFFSWKWEKMVTAWLLLLLSTTWAAPRSMLQGFTAINRIVAKSKVISDTNPHQKFAQIAQIVQIVKDCTQVKREECKGWICLQLLLLRRWNFLFVININENHHHFHDFHYPQHRPDFFALFKHFLKGSRHQLIK